MLHYTAVLTWCGASWFLVCESQTNHAHMFYGRNVASVTVISMLLGCWHNKAVSDGMSWRPSAGVGGVNGRLTMKDIVSPHIWEQVASQGDFAAWSMARRPPPTVRHEQLYHFCFIFPGGSDSDAWGCDCTVGCIFYTMADSLVWRGLTTSRPIDGRRCQASRKHSWCCDCSVFQDGDQLPQPAVTLKGRNEWRRLDMNIKTGPLHISSSFWRVNVSIVWVIIMHLYISHWKKKYATTLNYALGIKRNKAHTGGRTTPWTGLWVYGKHLASDSQSTSQ